jgi:sulfur carrier protein
MIRIDNKEFQFVEGMTVADALKLAGESVDQVTIVMLNGNVVSREDLDRTHISDNSKIRILRLISGG